MTCTAEGDFGAITADAALCVYRIAQEALRNVIAHAGASHADVRLLQMDDRAQITIADDGRGSTPATALSETLVSGSSACPSARES